MVHKIILTSLLLVLASVPALAQQSNSLGFRLGSFNTGLSFEGDDGVNFGLSGQVVKDWARGEQGFLRGRLGLSTAWSGTAFYRKDMRTSNNVHSLMVGIGRGKRKEIGPFALTYGADALVDFKPVARRLYQDRFETSQELQLQRNGSVGWGVGAAAGIFLQLEWNIRKNIWIGFEQTFRLSYSYDYVQVYNERTNTDLQTGVETHGFASTSYSTTRIAHPFQFTSPLFSVTFRPGGK